MNPSLLIN